ncbi:MAG: zinc-binding dehydrogenase [Chloroflexota bacterium]|nr:zinc-binding dehydrogenase [Chloroflexota bacterium]
MSDRWQQYRQATGPLPSHNLTWPFAGRSLESVGVDGQPVRETMPTCGPDEILVRVDALGLCASDAKMIRMGHDYPLFFERDFDADPARLGHEAALTAVIVGDGWQAQYYAGQRLGIQPDVYVDGKRTIFGVNIPGAMAQYVILERGVLASDFGSCIFPVLSDVSYADIALLEPWACVDVAYRATARRPTPKQDGLLWIKGNPGDRRTYRVGCELKSRHIVLTNVPPSLARELHSRYGVVAERPRASAVDVAEEFAPDTGLDDIILIDPKEADHVAEAVDQLASRGTLNLVTNHSWDEPVAVDMNKLHYQHLALLGCTGPDIADAYGTERNRSELRPGGVIWILGAGGTMGRMHIQRALQLPNGPRAIIATNRGQERLNSIINDFSALAATSGRELVAFNPTMEPGRLQGEISRLTGGRGCDDIVVVVPNPAAVAEALPFLAADGMLVVFAGAEAGNSIKLPLDRVSLYGAQFTGTSGSTVADQLQVLEKIQDNSLSATRTVAAIGGMKAMRHGLQAVLEKAYPGKVVIFPQLIDLPLLSLPELEQVLPDVYRQLDPGPTWTAQAERVLIEKCWTL